MLQLYVFMSTANSIVHTILQLYVDCWQHPLLCACLQAEDGYVCVFIISTYTEGRPPEGAQWFCQWLEDTAGDFRVQKTLLSDLYYAVFGLGDSLYQDHFCTVSAPLTNFPKSGSHRGFSVDAFVLCRVWCLQAALLHDKINGPKCRS